jgi:integrase
MAHGDGRYAKLLRTLSRVDLLILDDWGPEVLTAQQRRDLLEIVEDRYNARSLLITSQILRGAPRKNCKCSEYCYALFWRSGGGNFNPFKDKSRFACGTTLHKHDGVPVPNEENVMLGKFFDSSPGGLLRVRSLREGVHGSLLDSFSGALLQSRYANITARKHLRAAEHFAHWANSHGIAMPQWNDSLLERFGRHLRQRRCPYGHSRPTNQLTGASLFLEHLHITGTISSASADPTDRPAVLVSFRRWMREQRGTLDVSLDNYDIPIRTLLEHLGDSLEQLNAQRLRQCFLMYCSGKSHTLIKHGATALRMFVRFLIAEGRCPVGLEAAIPLVPHWRLSSLPRYLQPEEVERILALCNPITAVGKRDRAILLLLARLGLRAGDIVQLHLSDIDWKDAWVHVYGKSRRQTRLPLTQEVGDALVSYLLEGRPQTDRDRVFLCCSCAVPPLCCPPRRLGHC